MTHPNSNPRPQPQPQPQPTCSHQVWSIIVEKLLIFALWQHFKKIHVWGANISWSLIASGLVSKTTKCISTSGLLNLSSKTENTEILNPSEPEPIDRKQSCRIWCTSGVFTENPMSPSCSDIISHSLIGCLGCLRRHPMEACRCYAVLHNTLLPVLCPPPPPHSNCNCYQLMTNVCSASESMHINPWKSVKINENLLKSSKTNENPCKSTKIHKNQWKSMRIDENPCKSFEIH